MTDKQPEAAFGCEDFQEELGNIEEAWTRELKADGELMSRALEIRLSSEAREHLVSCTRCHELLLSKDN